MNEENPLVSIIVITYNSSKYVLETLESAKAQTYQNIELIISDDASTDNTVEICREWVETHKDRFVRTGIITSEKNTGIAPNCNRGIRAAEGCWIKLMAGDDALIPTIIEDYLKYLGKNRGIRVIHSNVKKYNEEFIEENLIETTNLAKLKINREETSAENQFQILLRSGPIMAATAMIKMDVFHEVGLYDERSPFWEDNPMWINITLNGIKIHFMDVIGAKYRMHEESVQLAKKGKNLFSKYKLSRDYFYKMNYLKYLPLGERIISRFLIERNIFLSKLFQNKRTLLSRTVFYVSGYLPQIIERQMRSPYLL